MASSRVWLKISYDHSIKKQDRSGSLRTGDFFLIKEHNVLKFVMVVQNAINILTREGWSQSKRSYRSFEQLSNKK